MPSLPQHHINCDYVDELECLYLSSIWNGSVKWLLKPLRHSTTFMSPLHAFVDFWNDVLNRKLIESLGHVRASNRDPIRRELAKHHDFIAFQLQQIASECESRNIDSSGLNNLGLLWARVRREHEDPVNALESFHSYVTDAEMIGFLQPTVSRLVAGLSLKSVKRLKQRLH